MRLSIYHKYFIFYTLLLVGSIKVYASPNGKTAIQFRAEDNFLLQGYMWKQQHKAPAIILLPQCDLDQEMYVNLGNLFYDAGFHVLTFDYRGIGKSASPDFNLATTDNKSAFWRGVAANSDGDMRSAINYLQSAVKVSNLSVLGASCGGDKAIKLAVDNPGLVVAIGIFSGRLSSKSIAMFNNLNQLPAFFIAAEGDKGAIGAARAGLKVNQSPLTTSHFYYGSEHGFSLFQTDPNLQKEIVDWFRKIAISL